MIYSGIILDEQKNPLAGVAYAVLDGATNTIINNGAIFFTGQDGRYSIDIPSGNYWLDVFKKGYHEPVFSVSQLANASTIILKKVFPTWAIIAVLGAVAVVLAQKKKSGKVAKIESADVITIFVIVGGIIAFSLVKKILEALGIWKDPNDKAIDEISSDPSSFWSPNYWQTINPNGAPWTYALTESQAADIAKVIYNAFGLLKDDRENVIAQFHSLRTKANVSFLAWEFNKQYNADLLTYIRNGGGVLPWDGLSSSDVVSINNYLSQLPNY